MIPKLVLIHLFFSHHPTMSQNPVSKLMELQPCSCTKTGCPLPAQLYPTTGWVACGLSSKGFQKCCLFSLTHFFLSLSCAALMSPFSLERSQQEAEKNRVLTNELRVILTELNN